MINVDKRVKDAIQNFWLVRNRQAQNQGTRTGQRDSGLRTAVTGGKHLVGFVELCKDILISAGLPSANVFWKKGLDLPGFYRPEKNWDLLAVIDGHLLAVLEFKAQVGPSFGNNFNNRTEEAIGNATDLWAAYREGAYATSQRPWLGFAFILEDCPKSRSSVRVKETHFNVFPEFNEASYAKRYEILLTKLLRERLYDGVSLLLTTKTGGIKGEYSCPSEELSFIAFARSLYTHALAYSQFKKDKR